MSRLEGVIKHSYACGLMFAGIAISVCAHAQMVAESVKTPSVDGVLNVETATGKENDGSRHHMFPHFTLNLDCNLGRGWSAHAELEYQRDYMDGRWENAFADNFSSNMLCLNKKFCGYANVSAGIIPVPIGISNVGGECLTIYDPESESSLLPIVWHDAALSFHGRAGRLGYQALLLGYVGEKARADFLGAALRLEYRFTDVLVVGASAFAGNTTHGSLSAAAPPFVALSGADISYASADFQYVGSHWVVDGSAVFAIGEKSSFGVEAGYNVLSFWKQTEEGKSFLPFVRYDGVWGGNRHADSFNKITFGLNFEWIPNLQLKVEKSARFISGETQLAYNIGVNYTLEF